MFLPALGAWRRVWRGGGSGKAGTGTEPRTRGWTGTEHKAGLVGLGLLGWLVSQRASGCPLEGGDEWEMFVTPAEQEMFVINAEMLRSPCLAQTPQILFLCPENTGTPFFLSPTP